MNVYSTCVMNYNRVCTNAVADVKMHEPKAETNANKRGVNVFRKWQVCVENIWKQHATVVKYRKLLVLLLFAAFCLCFKSKLFSSFLPSGSRPVKLFYGRN